MILYVSPPEVAALQELVFDYRHKATLKAPIKMDEILFAFSECVLDHCEPKFIFLRGVDWRALEDRIRKVDEVYRAFMYYYKPEFDLKITKTGLLGTLADLPLYTDAYFSLPDRFGAESYVGGR